MLRVLGQARRAATSLEDVVSTSLRAVIDNPIYVLPDSKHPHGRVIHNGSAYVAMNGLSEAWVDIATLTSFHLKRLDCTLGDVQCS